MHRIAVLVLVAGMALPAAAVAHFPALPGAEEVPPQERISVLETLIGQWSLTGREHGVQGSSWAASGVRTCRWALAGTAIRCDDRYQWITSLDGEERRVSTEDSLFYLSFDNRTGTYEYTYYSADVAELQTATARFDPIRGTLTGVSRVTDLEGQDRLAKSVSQFLSRDRILEKLSITLPGGERETHLLELVLERRDGPLPPVMHF